MLAIFMYLFISGYMTSDHSDASKTMHYKSLNVWKCIEHDNFYTTVTIVTWNKKWCWMCS